MASSETARCCRGCSLQYCLWMTRHLGTQQFVVNHLAYSGEAASRRARIPPPDVLEDGEVRPSKDFLRTIGKSNAIIVLRSSRGMNNDPTRPLGRVRTLVPSGRTM
jgi:hypothetical protein